MIWNLFENVCIESFWYTSNQLKISEFHLDECENQSATSVKTMKF